MPQENRPSIPPTGKGVLWMLASRLVAFKRETRYFYCRHTKVNESAPCHNMTINESELETALYGVLSKQAQIILNIDNLSNAGLLDLRLAEQADYGQQVEGFKAQKRVLYEQIIISARRVSGRTSSRRCRS